jgi:hypothetical protein
MVKGSSPFARTSLVVAALIGCGGSTVGTPPSANDAGSDTRATTDAAPPPVPQQHRPGSPPCTAPRPAGYAITPAPSGSQCTSDNDCTKGLNGRCNGQGALGHATNACSYDACTSDTDCGGAQVCDCRNTVNQDANTCFHGDCRVDSDCGDEYCSPSLTGYDPASCPNVVAGSVGYFCHTRQDACIDDSECNPQSGGTCSFDVNALRWQCFKPLCVGGLGSSP